jgi:hypothetical protein
MFKRTEFKIGKRFEEVLRSASLDCFDRLMSKDLGVVIHAKYGQEVRKIEMKTGNGRKLFYLKRCMRRASEALPAPWWCATLPCERELTMIRALQAHDIPVMRPAAWGRRTVLGLRREGFLLVEAVNGQEMINLFRDADQSLRLRLVQAMGTLLGRLNSLGFFQRIRLRDLICTDTPNSHQAPVRLVLIDRETTCIRSRQCSAARCIECLARCYCKVIQLRHRFDAREISSFANAYISALTTRGLISRRELINRTRHRVEKLTAPGGKYHELRDRVANVDRCRQRESYG